MHTKVFKQLKIAHIERFLKLLERKWENNDLMLVNCFQIYIQNYDYFVIFGAKFMIISCLTNNNMTKHEFKHLYVLQINIFSLWFASKTYIQYDK